MAYNLQSLVTILQQILNHDQPRWIVDHNKSQLESLLQKAESLQHILGKSSFTRSASLESQIRDAAYEAEDIIELHMVDQMLSTPEGVSLTFCTPDLRHVTQELDSAMEQLVKLMEGKTTLSGSSCSTDAPLSSSKNDLVGVDADLLHLKDRLTNMQSKLVEIIPIIGMGGIGKSTLARNLYDDPLIISHFDYRGWAAISQDYDMLAILFSLLRGPNKKLNKELVKLTDNELKEKLRKRLFGRRYMIVLDDIWITKVWDEIRMYFPDNNSGSRIVITTRESNVAKYASPESLHHHVELLNESSSWNLLRQIVFGQEDCSDELQRIGTKIANDCHGLPLAIHVIGRLLSKVERSVDVWELVSIDVKSAIVESDKQFSNILSLSYSHLPVHLKPCFLYMGALPEDCVINGSRLMYIWIAEGFVKACGDKSLEEEAEHYLKALVERNLLLVTRKKSNGKPMSYSIHDLMRELCIRKANEEKFLHVKKSQRRVSVHSSYEMEDVLASPHLMLLARSFICTEDKISFPVLGLLRVLRVLHAMEVVLEEFPEEMLQLVNLRYLAFSCTSGLPTEISRLLNLQTLISQQDMPFLPHEVLEISELRHVRVRTVIEIEEGYKIKFVHEKLQTLYYVGLTTSLIKSGFFAIIPNIRKLGIYCIHSLYTVVDLSHLHKLETLKCESDFNEGGGCFLQKLILPCNLIKLTLTSCVLSGSFLTTLCALQNLEVLKITESEFESKGGDEEWDVTEGDEFRALQFLCLNSLNLARLIANETNFPRLQRLFIVRCYEMEGIPCAIGDVPTLKHIFVFECGASVVASAREIRKEQQEEYDNHDLQVDIY